MVHKHWYVLAILLLGILALSFVVRDPIARIMWYDHQSFKWGYALSYTDEKLLMDIGNYYFSDRYRNLNLALEAYTKAVEIEPAVLWGNYQISRIHFIRGEFEDALISINKELEANPENLRSLYVRGLIYGYRGKDGDLEKSEQDFKQFTLWAPREWAGYNDYAWILSLLGKHWKAKEVIISAFEKVPDAENNAWLWNTLGVAELNLGEYRNAKMSFNKAQSLTDSMTIEDWNLAYPGNDPVDRENGLSEFKKAIEVNLSTTL